MNENIISNEQRARKVQGKGRWIVEYWDSVREAWGPTIWRGVTLEIALVEMKRMHVQHYDLEFRARDVDTKQEILSDML